MRDALRGLSAPAAKADPREVFHEYFDGKRNKLPKIWLLCKSEMKFNQIIQ